MTIRRYFDIPRGSDAEMTVLWSTETGPVDLAGWTIRWRAWAPLAPETLLLDADDLAGLTIDEPAGSITMPLTAAVTTNLPSPLVYDLLVSAPDAEPEDEPLILARGTIVVAEFVTPSPPRPVQTVGTGTATLQIPGPPGPEGPQGPEGPPPAPLEFDSVVFVAKVGDDANDGTDLRNPKLTFASAMTQASVLLGTVDRVKVEVLDAGSYTEAGDLTIPANVSVVAPQATYTGRVFLETYASFEINTHYPSESNQRMLNRTFGGADAGTAWYKAHISDGRGADGTLTHSSNIFNQGGTGRNLFVDLELIYVTTNGVGISDIAGGNAGHIHFILADLYLAGGSAVGIKATSAESNIIGYVDHILEVGNAIGSSGIRVVAAGADVRVTAGGIVADTAYYITAGDLYLSCPKIVGTKTGTPTQLMLGTADRPQQEVEDGASLTTVITALKAANIFVDPA